MPPCRGKSSGHETAGQKQNKVETLHRQISECRQHKICLHTGVHNKPEWQSFYWGEGQHEEAFKCINLKIKEVNLFSISICIVFVVLLLCSLSSTFSLSLAVSLSPALSIFFSTLQALTEHCVDATNHINQSRPACQSAKCLPCYIKGTLLTAWHRMVLLNVNRKEQNWKRM